MHEIIYVHPQTAQWLKDHGYIYQHEVFIPDCGRADFIAIHQDSHEVLIVECKKTCKHIRGAIEQVKIYRDHYLSSARMAVAVPSRSVTIEAIRLCREESILLIGVETLWNRRRETEHVPGGNSASDARAKVRDYLAAHPEAATMSVRELAAAAGVGKTVAAEVKKSHE